MKEKNSSARPKVNKTPDTEMFFLNMFSRLYQSKEKNDTTYYKTSREALIDLKNKKFIYEKKK